MGKDASGRATGKGQNLRHTTAQHRPRTSKCWAETAGAAVVANRRREPSESAKEGTTHARQQGKGRKGGCLEDSQAPSTRKKEPDQPQHRKSLLSQQNEQAFTGQSEPSDPRQLCTPQGMSSTGLGSTSMAGPCAPLSPLRYTVSPVACAPPGASTTTVSSSPKSPRRMPAGSRCSMGFGRVRDGAKGTPAAGSRHQAAWIQPPPQAAPKCCAGPQGQDRGAQRAQQRELTHPWPARSPAPAAPRA